MRPTIHNLQIATTTAFAVILTTIPLTPSLWGQTPAGGNGVLRDLTGFHGEHSLSRESSGTSWQPEATPPARLDRRYGRWTWTVQGAASLVYTRQGGGRGDDEIYSPNMLSIAGRRPLGAGTFGFHSGLSAETVTINDRAYPELLQTGTTGDGRTPLVDRQHPHDLFAELAVSYSLPLPREAGWMFAYLGLPGDPALGPPDVVRRFSGIDFPEAPITWDWFDSSHTSFGTATLGYVYGDFKLDASIFSGRRPDQHRSDLEPKLEFPEFDSYSARLSYNPAPAWAFQVSYGIVNSPEKLRNNVDVDRITASAIYHRSWDVYNWQTTVAWGRNDENPGHVFDAFLIESAFNIDNTHTILCRLEHAEKDGLFPPGNPDENKSFAFFKASLGYVYDFTEFHHVRLGTGAMGSAHFIPGSLESEYGRTPLSFQVFIRARL